MKSADEAHDVLVVPGLQSNGAGESRAATTDDATTTAQPGRDAWWARFRWLLTRVWLWPTLLTAALGLFRIGRPELWRDELRSWSAASRPIGDLIHTLGVTDAAVALYYLILHGWIKIFGDSATSMRMVSLIAMAAAAGVVSLIGRRLYGPAVGLVGGLIFALIPAVSRFAQEVRPYAITMLLVALSTLLYLRALERSTWPRWLGYALSVAGVALAQVVALPVFAAHAVGLLVWHRRDRRMWLTWAAWAAAGLVLASPVILLGASQYDHQVGSLPAETFDELTTLPPRLFSSTIVAGAVATMCLFGFGRKIPASVFLTSWALLPIAAVWVVSNLGQSYWMTRYMLPTLPGFAILAAAGLMALADRRMIALGVVAVAALGVPDQRMMRWVGAHDQWNYPYGGNAPVLYSEAAQLIADHQRPGDGIMYLARDDYWLLDIGMAYHLRGQPAPRDVLVQESAVARGDFWVRECDDAAECVGATPRIWLVSASVVYGTDLDKLEPDKRAVLEEQYRLVETYKLTGIAVTLWQRVQ